MLHVSAFTSNNGQLESRCRRCKAAYYGRDTNNILISTHDMEPIVDFLKFHLGSKRAICDRIGVPRSYLSERRQYRHGKHFKAMCDIALEITQAKSIQYRHDVDRQVVKAEPLGTILREWVADFKKEWGISEKNGKTGNDEITFGASGLLNEKTGISYKKIKEIVNSDRPLVALSDADKLIAAIHRPELIVFGEIPVFHNPAWSPKKHIEKMKEIGLI